MEFLKRIFGQPEKSRPSSPAMNPQEATRIVNAYGAVLEKGGLGLVLVADVNTLPYPKNKIKAALLYAMNVTTDRQMRWHLAKSFISLAEYQVGVGETVKAADVNSIDPGDLHAVASALDTQVKGYAKWKPIVDAETDESVKLLRKLGLMDGS